MPFLKISIRLLFLVVSQFYFTQDSKEQEQIYELIRESDKYNGSNDIKSLELAKKASSLAEKYGSSRDRAISDIFVSNALTSLSMYKESFVFLERSLNEKYAKEDVSHLLTVKLIKASNYWKLNLNDQSFKELHDILSIADKSQKNIDIVMRKCQATKNIAENFYEIGNMDSAMVYINKTQKLLMPFVATEPVVRDFDLPNVYLLKSKVFLTKKEKDSSYYYLNMGFNQFKRDPENSLDKFYDQYGDFYYRYTDLQKALKYYLLSIDEMKNNNINDVDSKIRILRNIANIYGRLGKFDKMALYLERFDRENEKTSLKKKESIQKAVNHIIGEKASEISYVKKEKNGWIIITIVICIIVISASVAIYLWYRKRKRIINEELKVKDRLISENQNESYELRQKLNETFDEIIILAQQNHPNFYTRFVEVYPDFQTRLLMIDKNLKNSELVLLAYVFLNFKTKEIAEYTFKSTRTVQNRKHLLRKKLQVPANDDFYIWINTTVNQ